MGDHRDEHLFPPARSEGGARVFPHNLNAERCVLGGIILRNDVLALLPELEPEDFYAPQHLIIFAAVRALEATAKPIDVITLENEIEKQGKLGAIGGIAYLGEISLLVPSTDNTASYASLVVEYRRRRDLLLALSAVTEDAYMNASDSEQLIRDIMNAAMGIRGGIEVRVVPMGQLACEEGERVIADVDAKDSGVAVFTGVPTGITAIDERIGGHPIGKMTIYAARPGAGKSTSGMMLAAAAKRVADMDSLLCSTEDSEQNYGQRSLAQESGLSTERLRARKIHRDDIDTVRRGMARATKIRGELFAHCADMEVEDIVRLGRRVSMQRKMRGEKPLRQVVVDYLQKVKWPRWAKGATEAVGHISDTLSRWASTDQIAVVAFCQLNRDVENRDDHMPRLADLRDSGKLEQDGKLIFGVLHPWSYDHKEHPESLWQLGVIKNDNGRNQFTIDLYWDRETHSIYDSELDYQQARIARNYQ